VHVVKPYGPKQVRMVLLARIFSILLPQQRALACATHKRRLRRQMVIGEAACCCSLHLLHYS
jgi:hypothetical protein